MEALLNKWSSIFKGKKRGKEMRKIYVIDGKKYEWKLENVHPVLLIGFFLSGLAAAAVSFWFFVSTTVIFFG